LKEITIANSDLFIFPDRDDLSIGAADEIATLAQEAVKNTGRFTIALSGGSTPRQLYGLLASEPWVKQMPWSKTHIFFGDERCVSQTDAQSNFKMVNDVLLSRVPIPKSNIHALIGQDANPEAAAQQYQQQLNEFFGNTTPVFDLILLGIGPEGHTASIFPNSPALTEKQKFVMAYLVDDAHGWRITMTLPVINLAKQIMFLVAGSEKKDIVGQIFGQNGHQIPAKLVSPSQGLLSWYLDESAAQKVEAIS
jgi:6-phosphogluconolactonase